MQTQTTTNAPMVNGHLPRILVVDDEPSFTRLMKLNLEETGRYVVEVVNDPTHALETARFFRPDLVLLDVMMPGLDGGDVANLFREDKVLAKVPVVFLTATVKHGEVDSHQGTFGGMRFLSKPVVLPELLAFLDEHFSHLREPVRVHS